MSSLLSETSQQIYESAYERFEKWCEGKHVLNITNERVLVEYFEDLATCRKPNSLWSNYSMLRRIIFNKKHVNIGKYKSLSAFLKRTSDGYVPKKSKVLTNQDVARFLREADDERFLLKKVTLIVGLSGACRRDDLTNLMVENVHDLGQCIRVVIPTSKTKMAREFFITQGDVDGVNMLAVVRKYIQLRPTRTENGRFFLSYRNGKCTRQPVGINTIASMPKNIASFLKLENPGEYTGHCFRRSSSSLLGHVGVSTVKQYGGWTSSAVSDEYIHGGP